MSCATNIFTISTPPPLNFFHPALCFRTIHGNLEHSYTYMFLKISYLLSQATFGWHLVPNFPFNNHLEVHHQMFSYQFSIMFSGLIVEQTAWSESRGRHQVSSGCFIMCITHKGYGFSIHVFDRPTPQRSPVLFPIFIFYFSWDPRLQSERVRPSACRINHPKSTIHQQGLIMRVALGPPNGHSKLCTHMRVHPVQVVLFDLAPPRPPNFVVWTPDFSRIGSLWPPCPLAPTFLHCLPSFLVFNLVRLPSRLRPGPVNNH